MAKIDSLRTHLVDELRDTLDAEQQLIQALPRMAKLAQAPRLKQALRAHLAETRQQAARVKQALRLLGESTQGKTCEGMQGLIEEGDELANQAPEGPVRDAVIISAAQKVEHYEIAAYGTAATYASVLGESQVKRLLGQSLREEKSADEKLTGIAERSVNARAAEAWATAQEEDSVLEQGAQWVGTAARRAAQSLGIAADARGAGQRTRRTSRSSGSSGGSRRRKTARRSRKK
jgi:ferritin-like metal-binding protein YciE